jgi:hypothetical protein
MRLKKKDTCPSSSVSAGRTRTVSGFVSDPSTCGAGALADAIPLGRQPTRAYQCPRGQGQSGQFKWAQPQAHGQAGQGAPGPLGRPVRFRCRIQRAPPQPEALGPRSRPASQRRCAEVLRLRHIVLLLVEPRPVIRAAGRQRSGARHTGVGRIRLSRIPRSQTKGRTRDEACNSASMEYASW